MAENSHISWTDDTFNPWEGCQKVGPGCDGCYAEARNIRYAPVGATAAPNWGPGAPRRRTSEANWKKPLKWNREAATAGKPRFVFCASLADVFDNAVPVEWRRDLFDLIRATPHLTWLLLTKRPGNIVKMFQRMEEAACGMDVSAAYLQERWPRNAAIGCTIVNQEEANRDIPNLLRAKLLLNPAFAFLSMEPLLGAVNLKEMDVPTPWKADDVWKFDALTGRFGIWMQWGAGEEGYDGGSAGGPGIDGVPDYRAPRRRLGIDWVIAGGETDQGAHKARPSHPDWFRSLRDQCATAGVPFHFKQWGEFLPPSAPMVSGALAATSAAQRQRVYARPDDEGGIAPGLGMVAVGKAKAGRLLDGVEHNARPEIAA